MSALFLANGALIANVVPRFPTIKSDLALSNAGLGSAIAAGAVGGMAAGLAAGLLIARLGSGRLTVIAGLVYSAGLTLVGIAPGWAALAGTLLLLGGLDSVMDVAMNAHALRVQSAYGRSVLNGFHAWWSIGALLGGATGSIAAALGVPVAAHLAVVGVVVAGLVAFSARSLLPGPDPGAHPSAHPSAHPPAPPAARPAGRPGRRSPAATVLLLMAPLLAVALLAGVVEDAPASWSAVYLREVVGSSAGVAGLGFTAFAAAMAAARLASDRAVDRFGYRRVVRAGGLAAGSGALLAVALPTPMTVIAGFALVGVGSAPVVPALFHAGGTWPGVRPGDGVAVVSWVLRTGFLVAPPVVGLVADAAGLRYGLLLPVLAGFGVALGARVAEPGGATRRAA